MKRAKQAVADDGEIQAEYDFSKAVRAKYYERFQQSSNVVVLDPDVSESFPNSESVNKALRTLATVARRSVRVQRRSSSLKKRPNKRLQQTRSAKRRRSGPRS